MEKFKEVKLKYMNKKSIYSFENINYCIISRNDIDLKKGKNKIDSIIQQKESLIISIEEILLRPDSKRTVYFYNEDITGEEKPIDFLNEIKSKFDNYSVYINMNICKDYSEYSKLNEDYKEVANFFEENDNVSLAINGTIVENKEGEYIDMFVSI